MMESIGKQQIILINGNQVTGVIWTPDYSKGIAQVKGSGGLRRVQVQYSHDAPGTRFPYHDGDHELKTIWREVQKKRG